jgi:GT2 family glycosyltransferase
MKIGVGIITCNRPEFFRECYNSLPLDKIDEVVVINDGDPKVINFSISKGVILNNPKNLGVGKSKNRALKYLYENGCDYLFLLEDDMIIKSADVFEKYIDAYKQSGIHHFNYGPGSPFNRKQTIQNFDLHNRHLLDQHSQPNPKMIVDYRDVKVALYEHTVAMFSFFTREIIEKVGYIDEEYYNAWEHVDHTYRIIKAGYHPPFWWFADIANSDEYLTEAPGAIDNSSIANKTEQWEKNVYGGREIYKRKHGHYPNQPPHVTKEQVIESLKQIKKNIHE